MVYDEVEKADDVFFKSRNQKTGNQLGVNEWPQKIEAVGDWKKCKQVIKQLLNKGG